MPRSVEEILAHADELAARFENYDPRPGDELDVTALHEIRAAVAEKSAAERHLITAIRSARQGGMSWASIGSLVGTTGEAARQRYATFVA